MNNSNLEKGAHVVGRSFLKRLKDPYNIVNGILVTGILVGGAVGLSRESHPSNNMTLEVNCKNPWTQGEVAIGLNESEEQNITVETPEGKVQMTAQLGKYSIVGAKRMSYPGGKELFSIGSAELVTGALSPVSNTYTNPNKYITLVCINGEQPKNISGGS